MRTIEIKGIVPGAGKTTLLAKIFARSNLKNKIILTPSNKSRQEVIHKLIDLGWDSELAENCVKTMRKFKQNFMKFYTTKEYLDIESGEWLTEQSNLKYISRTSTRHFKKTYNIFVDEASMFSNREMTDLIENWKIRNLILVGDSLQFDPIAKNEVLEVSDDEAIAWFDDGSPYNLIPNTQILLAKNMRSRDENLKKLLEWIKAGTPTSMMNALKELSRNTKKCEKKESDWHIAYTNAQCDKLNSLYSNPTRWIVTHSDEIHSFFKSEVLDWDSPRLNKLERDLFSERAEFETDHPGMKCNIPTFEEWKKNYLKPAYGLTCHKLQGSTIEEGQIYIHLADLIQSMEYHIDSYEEKARLLQKYLYVACSRAVQFDQLNLYSSAGISKQNKVYDFTFSEGLTSFSDELGKILDKVEPMVDPFIRENCEKFEDYDKACDTILNSFDYSDDKISLKGQDEYEERERIAHSIKHKQHKQRSDRMSDEFIELARSRKEAEWCKLTGLSSASYYNARRIVKSQISKVEFLGFNDSKLDDSWTICGRFDRIGEYNPNGDQVCVNKPLPGLAKNRYNDGVKKENYLFECDAIDKKEQVRQIEMLPDEVRNSILWVCDTGGKSIHCVIRTNTPDDASPDLRKYIHNTLNSLYFNGEADPSTSNASRLARAPNAIRQDNKHPGKLQKCFHFNMEAQCLDVSDIVAEFEKFNEIDRGLKEIQNLNRKKNTNNSSCHTLEDLKNWNNEHPSPAKQECIEFLSGNLRDWNRSIACVRSLRNFGFTDSDIEAEGQFDDKWIKSALKYIKKEK